MTLKVRIRRLEIIVEAKHRALTRKRDVERSLLRAHEATKDTWTWLRGHTRTYNPHWVEEGLPSPYEPFPDWPYFPFLFDCLESDERIWWFEKSRDMMLTWACVAFLTLQAMKVPEREILFQTQKEKKAVQLIDYAKCLYDRQDDFLNAAYPLLKPSEDQPELELHFANGSGVIGIPGRRRPDSKLSPMGYLNDESSFQPDAGECYTEALAAVRGKIVFNSSAGPGWYADTRRDIIRNGDD